jgi:hypothetical protein
MLYEINVRESIINKLEKMISKCGGIGYNPYVVNVITYSGHGFIYKGDTIAAIPEYKDKKNKEQKVLRFINISEWARKFAEKKKTLSIFILSMCRIEVDDADVEKVLKEAYFDEKLSDFYQYKFLLKDADFKYSKNAP